MFSAFENAALEINDFSEDKDLKKAFDFNWNSWTPNWNIDPKLKNIFYKLIYLAFMEFKKAFCDKPEINEEYYCFWPSVWTILRTEH